MDGERQVLKEARPTSALVLQALFNILGPASSRSFLDLFAGRGRVGTGASERGFSPVVFVELSGKNVNAIASRIDLNGCEIIRMDVRRALPLFASRSRRFDVIFADPPYDNGWVKRLASLSGRLSGIMNSGGVFILEHTKRELLETSLWTGWDISSKTYGGTVLSFFQRHHEEEGESA